MMLVCMAVAAVAAISSSSGGTAAPHRTSIRRLIEGQHTRLASSAAPPCNGTNKQKALYVQYVLQPSLQASPATDLSVEVRWNSTADMQRYGSNGVYAANPMGFEGGLGGYFGSQADGDAARGGLLFSVWDRQRRPWPSNATASCAGGIAPNSTWCAHQHAFPLSDNCKRHCLDCGLHPGWTNTTGTQCRVALPISEGQGFRFRLFRSSNTTTLRDPLGMGLTYVGSEWTLTATRFTSNSSSDRSLSATGEVIVVGRMFLEDTHGGVNRLGAFHEHIGCTPCTAFYECEVRRGPWIDAPVQRAVQNITFARNPFECQLFDVEMLDIDGVRAAQFRTGPGTGPSEMP